MNPGAGGLRDLLSEISRLGAPSDRGRRIRLLRRSLEAEVPRVGTLTTREGRRTLRGSLLLQLGQALLEEATAGRPEAIEEALEALTEAAHLAADPTTLRVEVLRLLGMAALERRSGRREGNVERAIETLRDARSLAQELDVPRAEIDRLLAVAYLGRLAGDRSESLERAREHAEEAVRGLDPETDPMGWASARSVLGEASQVRLRGNELENLRRAVRCFETAADVKRGRARPLDRATAEAALLNSRLDLERAVRKEEPSRGSVPFDLPHRDLPDEALEEAGSAGPPEADTVYAAAVDHAAREVERGRDAHEEEYRPTRWVGSGFAAPDAAAKPLSRDEPLTAATDYLFWLEIGDRPVPGAIDDEAATLPESLDAKAELDVVLFGYPGGLEIPSGGDVGRLRLTATGAEVVRQPGGLGLPGLPEAIARRRLLFAVRTPDRAGVSRLRCNLYHRGLLLQSRLVSAWVDSAPPADEPALVSALDFNLSAGLDPGTLGQYGEADLALMLNDDGDDLHGLRLWGGPEVKLESSLADGALDDLVEQARRALRQASWGGEDEWAPGDGPPPRYRYDEPVTPQELRDDLVRLAIRGYRFYAAAVADLAGDGVAARALNERLRTPGRVQIVERRKEGRGPVVLPAALLYDFLGFDTNLPWDDYDLCPEFKRALNHGEDLASTDCFQGRCPVRDDPDRVERIVCPSGFWGFRHAIGLPSSVSEGGEAPPEIVYHDAPDLTIGVSLDPDFTLRDRHEATVHGLRPGLGWYRGASRREVLDLLRATRPHLVYLYCHGGLSGTLPFVLVGPPGERGITPDNLLTVLWQDPRPLVFINGCHTAALSSRRAFRFVDALVKTSGAAGVIGTEITVFEELARDFAEAFLKRFLVEEIPIGEAVRRARLDLLGRGNPLGLVYVPYVLPGVRLRRAA